MSILYRNFRYPLKVHLSSVFILLIILVAVAIGGLANYQAESIINKLTSKTFARIADEVGLKTARLFAPAETVVNLLSVQKIVVATTQLERFEHLDFILGSLVESENIISVYIGYDDGDFLLARRLPGDPKQQISFNAPPHTAFVVQSIDHDNASILASFSYLDADYNIIETRNRPDYSEYDPRQRPWFKLAKQTTQQVKTSPYLFFTTQEMGTTIARRSKQGNAVVAADITLHTLTQAMVDFKISSGSEVALVTTKGKLIATTSNEQSGLSTSAINSRVTNLDQLASPVLSRGLNDFGGDNNIGLGLVNDQLIGTQTWRTMVADVPLSGSAPYQLILAAPTSELLVEANEMLRDSMLSLGIVLLIFIPFLLYVGQWVARPIMMLVEKTEAIRRFDFNDSSITRSSISEVDNLALSIESMKTTIRQFMDISTAIAEEKDFDLLQNLILDETIAACRADGGIIYLLNEDDSHIIPTVMRNKEQAKISVNLSDIALDNRDTPLLKAIKTGEITQLLIDLEDDQSNDPELVKLAQKISEQASHNEHKTMRIIVTPLLTRDREQLGVLILFLTEIVHESHLSFISALSSTAAITIETRRLVETQKALFESFIQMIAGSIDAKSPYTGGHCERVPLLTKMLAEAAVLSTEGSFKDFSLSDEDWEAVHIASWLHDCGKVITPEFIVDKATKLETIYNRIHEIRMRFEVLKRDAEIDYWQAIANGNNQNEAQQQMQLKLDQLDDDFAFIATCNEGGEFLDSDKAERIQKIACYTWRRTLNDRLGMSIAEIDRIEDSSQSPITLPVMENILADKPEHCFSRDSQDQIEKDNQWGFDITVPELLYNRGELHNLLIERGTLTDEDRYKINQHIVQTIIMLSQLPFPKHLRQVPEIAGGHHEKMDGSGYPKRLTGEQLSPVARMMAIADIFEALTAVDRPYKKGKTLSESLRIMSFMKKDQHIDPELFDLFLSSGCYLRYAKQYMKADQIDQVDIEDYLN